MTCPAPAPDQLVRYYPASYYGGDRRFLKPVESGLGLLHTGRARRLARLSGTRSGRLLDIGCGRGSFLSAMRDLGWRVEGTELSVDAARGVEDRLGVRVHVGDVCSLALPHAAYDGVVLYHVLEHVHRPEAVVQEAARLLRPGGCLLVGVPNFCSPEARFGAEGWFHLDVPRHLVHFCPERLAATLRRSGFTIRRTVWSAPEFDLFSAVQTAENRAGLPRNTLYNMLRSEAARVAHVPALRRHRLVSACLAAMLAVPAAGWTIVAAALHRSATVTFYATRDPDPLAAAAGA